MLINPFFWNRFFSSTCFEWTGLKTEIDSGEWQGTEGM